MDEHIWFYLTKFLPHQHDYPNRLVSQVREPLTASREPAGNIWQLSKVLYFFNIKLNIFTSMLHLPALCYFDISVIYPYKFRQFLTPSCFIQQQYLWTIAIQASVSCYNVWTNSCCSGCSPLGENLCEMGLLAWWSRVRRCIPASHRTDIDCYMITDWIR